MKVFGPGVEPEGVKCDEPTMFTIDASEAGEGKPEVTIESTSKGTPLTIRIQFAIDFDCLILGVE